MSRSRAIVKVRKCGGAIQCPTVIITLPYFVLRQTTIRPGDHVRVTLDSKDKIVVEKETE